MAAFVPEFHAIGANLRLLKRSQGCICWHLARSLRVLMLNAVGFAYYFPWCEVQ